MILGQSATASARGWELANVQIGTDVWVAKRSYVGLFLSFSVGEMLSESGDILGTHAETSDFPRSLHEWMFAGLRGRLDL